MSTLSRRTLFASGAGLAALSLAACGGEEPLVEEGGVTTIRVAATPLPHMEILTFVSDNLAADAGIALDLQEQTEYPIPNRLLSEGEVDANFFQHLPYLETEIAENGYELTPFAGVHIEPLGIFSESLTSLDEIEDGAAVGIPNDPTNRGRALALLADQGLLALSDGIEPTEATPDDIAENPANLDFQEIDAALLPRTLGDYAIAVINGNYALEADLSPAEDALALESGEDNPYANMLVVRTEDEDNEALRSLDELLHSEDVRQFIEENYSGAVIPAF
ncbi:MetQ/NlpA family ABC transporter substrate-binding protein [Brachybacterium saurashtrense]|uniref:Lipoprotein n=1 Tax=Brachybacterium saurashtrense TaxID=556288 RepID=A0A345YSN0_9MICO|nr:MetQ/NlpA family ABC transporter substrate-binding protein [Brachybacterium saurashtrense]AXK46932.1 ABC transporter substrate-binding protein [Brachybacterium saurashtrense]RRR22647.1 ABC transporter substrate-binding protein [Brachybacterium saurashtrense]